MAPVRRYSPVGGLMMILAALPLLSGVAVAAVPAMPQAQGGDTTIVNFSLVPAHQAPGHRSAAFTIATGAGSEVSASAALVNPSSAPLTLTVGTAEAVTPPLGGGVGYEQRIDRQRTVGRWLTIDTTTNTVTVAPQHADLFTFTVHVPASAPPGQYIGALSATNTVASQVRMNGRPVEIHGQVLCLVNLRVLGRAAVGLRVESVAVQQRYSHAFLGLTLHNTGHVMDIPTGATLTLTDLATQKTIALQPSLSIVLPGGAPTILIPTRGAVAPGRYSAVLQVRYQASPQQDGHAQSYGTAWTGSLTIPAGIG